MKFSILTLAISVNTVFGAAIYNVSSALDGSVVTKRGFNDDVAVPHPNGRVQVGYFTNWGIYGRDYKPQQIPAEQLTHILYSFANVRAETGEVYLTDKWADEDIHWDGDSWNDEGTNLYGCFKQLYLLKKKHRHLKVLLSIGGWTNSPNIHDGISTPARRAEFVKSAISIVENYGLDGFDVDYEYPRNAEDAANYVELLRVAREGLDALAIKKSEAANGYELTVAAPCGPSNVAQLEIAEMDQYLSFWNLMSYEFAGSWSSETGHAAAIHSKGGLSGASCVNSFKTAGVKPEKLVLGLPLYGRSFASTTGEIGKPFKGLGKGSFEAGDYDYKSLPQPNTQIHVDNEAIGAYSYDPATAELVSFDTLATSQRKIDWLITQQLGGAMYWELSGDFPSNNAKSIVVNSARQLKAARDEIGLDTRLNHLNFPDSKFDNLKAGMA